MPSPDVEGVELKDGDVVVIPFVVRGVHNGGVALDPIDLRGLRHPRVTYDSRLCKKQERQAPVNEGAAT